MISEAPPSFGVNAGLTGKIGNTLTFSATSSPETPILDYHWDFGDGVVLDGAKVTHAYTQSRTYTLQITAMGLDAITTSKSLRVVITGNIPTTFVPAEKVRLVK
jgi:alpha-galactosidase